MAYRRRIRRVQRQEKGTCKFKAEQNTHFGDSGKQFGFYQSHVYSMCEWSILGKMSYLKIFLPFSFPQCCFENIGSGSTPQTTLTSPLRRHGLWEGVSVEEAFPVLFHSDPELSWHPWAGESLS